MKTCSNTETVREFFRSIVGKGRPFRQRTKLAEYLGMNRPSIRTKFYKYLDGDGGYDPAFGTVTAWLEKMGGKVLLPDEAPDVVASYRYIPKVAAIAGAGATLETSDEVLGLYAFRADWLGASHISDTRSVLMDIRGDSMEPLFKDGDTILVDQSDTQVQDGRIYVVTLGDELRVKRIQRSMTGLILRSDNPLYADITVSGTELDLFRVHGRVRWCGKMI